MPNPRTKCRWPCQPPCAACPATAPAGIAAKLPRTALPWKAPPWTAPTLPLRKAPALALWKAPTLPPWKAAAPPPWKPPPPPPWPPPPPPPWPPKAIAPVVIVVARATAIAPAISCFLIITSFTSHQPSIGQTTASEANWLRPDRPKPAQLFVMNERLFDASGPPASRPTRVRSAPPRLSLRAKRSNPWLTKEEWIASSLRSSQRWGGRPPTASVCQTGDIDSTRQGSRP